MEKTIILQTSILYSFPVSVSSWFKYKISRNKILFEAESLTFVPLTPFQNTLLSMQFGLGRLGKNLDRNNRAIGQVLFLKVFHFPAVFV